MSFSFKCSHCNSDIQAEEAWAGKQTTCPVCGQMITIPSPIAQEAAPMYEAPADAVPAQTPVPLGMATTALVLGLISFFLLIPFCGTVALILGIIALVKINKSQGLLLGKGKAITGIVCGAWAIVRFPVLAILAAMLLPALSKAREKAETISCISNMKQIGLGIIIFADDNKDILPKTDDCKEKIFEYVGDEKCFHCPASASSGDSYRFFVNGEKLSNIKKTSATIIAVCTSTHSNNTVNVLFADGHVASFKKAEVEYAIQNARPGTLPVLR